MITDPVLFLANIALVARSDGALSAVELGQLEAIRKECGFKKGDFSAAIRLAESGNYAITPVGTFADQVKNLEYILRVAYADSDLEVSEMALIQVFCKQIGVLQDQLEKLTAEVLASLKVTGKLCPACTAENTADARFCSTCGASLAANMHEVQVGFDIPPRGIAIEFSDSSAGSFPNALELAKATAGYQNCQKNNKTWHLATFPSGSLADAIPLANALHSMRNRVVYIDGVKQLWDDVFGFVWCASQRSVAYQPVEYCFGKSENRLNPWGCKQANMDWTEWANWFCYGSWEKSGFTGSRVQWRFDKMRIRHELATNLHQYRYCPFLNMRLTEAILRHLPDVVVPGVDKYWDYHQVYEEVPGAIKIVLKDRSEAFAYNREFWADGVRPKGFHVLASILAKAFREVGIDPGLATLLAR
ncbi:MAG: TerB family tellurite resistance protein [candidate division KSB1 bacterium]|nr:TerB family tellurite resistance protein [candidate division KSB1 bacterium]